MTEYIEREAVLQAVLELPPKMDEQGYGWLGRRGVWQMLLDFPAADVAPVRHGRNIWDIVPGHCEFKCSLCGAELSSVYGGENDFGMDGGNFKYCPNCGAKMDGGET